MKTALSILLLVFLFLSGATASDELKSPPTKYSMVAIFVASLLALVYLVSIPW